MASIIIKTVERCNINCTYCYFFNKKDKSYIKHPPYIQKNTIDSISSFLANGCDELGISNLRIIFHGGEPLMQKKNEFDYMCSKFKNEIGEDRISLSIQTNFLLIDEEWIDLLIKYDISTSISIDGPKIVHDKFRVDKKGRGTFEKTIEKLKFFSEKIPDKKICILSVANPDYPPEMIFDFFYNELGLKQFDFLMPDAHHDDPPKLPASEYGQFYVRLFKKILGVNKDVRIRFINVTVN